VTKIEEVQTKKAQRIIQKYIQGQSFKKWWN
jgi:hypothetical protein